MTTHYPAADAAPRVDVVGDRHLVLPVDLDAGRGLPFETLDCTLRCASGNPIHGPWTGVPIQALLDSVDAPADTTHLLVTGRDGVRACIPVTTALDGVLAFSRDGSASARGLPRLVAPELEGIRSVRGVRRVETVSLDADEDPAGLESSLGPSGE